MHRFPLLRARLRTLTVSLAAMGWLALPVALAQAPAAAPGTPASAPAAVSGSNPGAVAIGARATGAARTNQRGDFIVAVVNTELVTAVEVSQRLDRAAAEARRSGGGAPTGDDLRQQALDTLIDERVLITYARESGMRVDEAEIDRALANIAAQNQLSVAQLRERLVAEGMDYPRFRNNLRDQLMVERVREREVAARIRIADEDIDRLLEDFRSKAAAEVEYNIAQILVAVPEGADDAAVAEQRNRAEQAVQRLRAGEDWAKVAMEANGAGRADAGAAMGMKPASRLPDLFVEAVKGLAAGQVAAQPVRSAAGFHVLKLLERQEASAFKLTQTHARHILLRVAEREQTPAVVRRMEALRAQIEAGSKRFEAVAREVSEDSSAEAGGDLGWVAPGAFVPEFEEAMNKLAAGGLSAPVVSRFGVHLIQVLERRDVVPEQREIREQARNQLRETKYEQAYTDWVKELRLRAYVELRDPPL